MADLVPILRITDDDPLKMAAADEIERLRTALDEIRKITDRVSGISDERDSVPILLAVRRVIEQVMPNEDR